MKKRHGVHTVVHMWSPQTKDNLDIQDQLIHPFEKALDAELCCLLFGTPWSMLVLHVIHSSGFAPTRMWLFAPPHYHFDFIQIFVCKSYLFDNCNLYTIVLFTNHLYIYMYIKASNYERIIFIHKVCYHSSCTLMRCIIAAFEITRQNYKKILIFRDFRSIIHSNGWHRSVKKFCVGEYNSFMFVETIKETRRQIKRIRRIYESAKWSIVFISYFAQSVGIESFNTLL